MNNALISEKLKKELEDFLKKNPKTDLLNIYLFFIERKYNVAPVLFPKEKTIYQDIKDLIAHLEREKKLYKKTEIKIKTSKEGVNENTKKVYICPFTGKVFGDNTHPNPQDAIYEWVSKCPENKERQGGLKLKRFFVSEDPKIIKNYIKGEAKKTTKIVFSSMISGKLFSSQKAVIDDFINNHVKELSLFDVQNQNKYIIEDRFLKFIQECLTEQKITKFVKELSKYAEFKNYVKKWTR